MGTLLRILDVRPPIQRLMQHLTAGLPHCEDPACRQGRQCHGACTCVARVIAGHGPECDGACEGNCTDFDPVAPLRFDAFDRLCHRIVRAILVGWALFLAIAAGAGLSWAWQAGLIWSTR